MNSKLHNISFGVIGGSQGLGSWMVHFLRNAGLEVDFTSKDGYADYDSNEQLAKAVDVIILAVPISAMEEVLTEIFPHLHHKTLIDICSVKEFLIERFHSLTKEFPGVNVNYYSIHPMFSEKLLKLEGQVLLENFHFGQEQAFWGDFKLLFQEQQARWLTIEFRKHDQLMGIIQGLNHFNLFTSAKALSQLGHSLEEVKSIASPSYHIFLIFLTRYVMQNPRLYAEIQFFNRYTTEVLKAFKNEVEHLMQVLESKDLPAFENYVKEMQPFFASHQKDSLLSSQLINHLGELLVASNASKDL